MRISLWRHVFNSLCVTSLWHDPLSSEEGLLNLLHPTQITFKPDLARFGMAELEEDTVALMRKRVYDMAGVLNKVKVRHSRLQLLLVGWSG